MSRLGYFASVLNVTDQTDLHKLKLSLIPTAYPLRRALLAGFKSLFNEKYLRFEVEVFLFLINE